MTLNKQHKQTFGNVIMPEQDKNIPFLSNEIQEHFKQSRSPLMNTEPNRRARRATMKQELADYNQKPQMPIRNNRGGNGLHVYERMSYFYLKLNYLLSRRK